MKHSFEGIGQWSATFACGSGVAEGQVVKVSANGTVSACADGNGFAGVVDVVGRDGAACAVILSGMVEVPYTGTAPALGWSGLSANGTGGVKADTNGRACLVADVDTTGKLVTFVL